MCMNFATTRMSREPPQLDMFTIRGDADGRLTLAC